MKGRAGWRPLVAWLTGMVLVVSLSGCEGLFYKPPYAPAPPPAPPPAPVAPAPPSRPVLYVNVPRLNLRACPGMDCPRISVLEMNEAVEKMGEAEDWFQVRVTRDGRLGWVSSRYLSAEPVAGPPEAPVAKPPLPEVPPPPKPPAVEAPPPPARPPVAEKPRPAKPPEATPRPAKPARPAEAAEPTARKPAPPAAKPAEKPAPAEKPQPPAAPEPAKRIRIM